MPARHVVRFADIENFIDRRRNRRVIVLARESQVLTCFSVRAEKNEPAAQLSSHATQIRAISCVGHVAVQPLQKNPKIVSYDMVELYS